MPLSPQKSTPENRFVMSQSEYYESNLDQPCRTSEFVLSAGNHDKRRFGPNVTDTSDSAKRQFRLQQTSCLNPPSLETVGRFDRPRHGKTEVPARMLSGPETSRITDSNYRVTPYPEGVRPLVVAPLPNLS